MESKESFDLVENEASDKFKAALHEAGHSVILSHYHIPHTAYIVRIGDPSIEHRSWIGKTTWYGRLSRFRKAVMAWGGSIAEIYRFKKSERPKTFDEYFDVTDISEFSETDQAVIRLRKNIYLTGETAFKIITGKRAELLKRARIIAKNGAFYGMGSKTIQNRTGSIKKRRQGDWQKDRRI